MSPFCCLPAIPVSLLLVQGPKVQVAVFTEELLEFESLKKGTILQLRADLTSNIEQQHGLNIKVSEQLQSLSRLQQVGAETMKVHGEALRVQDHIRD